MARIPLVNGIYAGIRALLVTRHTREVAGSNPAAPIASVPMGLAFPY